MSAERDPFPASRGDTVTASPRRAVPAGRLGYTAVSPFTTGARLQPQDWDAGSGPVHPHEAALARAAAQIPAGAGSSPALVFRSCSRLYLAARSGPPKIETGSIQSYEAATNTAMVRLLGAQSTLIGPLPLAAGTTPDLAGPGASCLVLLLDQSNPVDAVIVAIAAGV